MSMRSHSLEGTKEAPQRGRGTFGKSVPDESVSDGYLSGQVRHGAPHRPLWAQQDHGVLRLPVATDQSLMDLWSRPSRSLPRRSLPQYDRQRGKYLGVPHLSVERASRGTKAPGRQLLFLPRCLTGSLWIPLDFAAQTQKTKECLRVTTRSCGKLRMKRSTSQSAAG